MSYRVLLTASRTWTDVPSIWRRLDHVHSEHPDMILVHGDCPEGGDFIGDSWARYRDVPAERHPADWSRGRGAGFARNAEMVAAGAARCEAFIRECEKPGCLRSRPHGTHGASHTAELAEKAGITVTYAPWPPREV